MAHPPLLPGDILSGDRRRILVAGWQPPPFNGRVHEVVSLTRAPFADAYEVCVFDTRMRDRRGGSRPDAALLRDAVAHVASIGGAVRRFKPDLTIVCLGIGSAFWRDMLLIGRCRRAGAPVMVRFLGGSTVDRILAFGPVARGRARAILGSAAALLTETCAMVEGLQTLCPRVPAFRVPNFIHLDDVTSPEPGRGADGPLSVVYVGNLTPLKGVETILGAVDRVCACTPAEFHFIGGELERGYFVRFKELAARLHHADAVHIHGRQPRDRAQGLASRSHVLAFPTRWPGEGQPAALIEAMAMGLAPIGSRWRGVAEVIRHEENGLLLEEPTSGYLSAAILRLAADRELLDRLGRSARRTVESEYSAEAALAQYRCILEQSLGWRA